MRIICTEPDDYKMALALLEVAGEAGTQADVVCRQDAFALTIWSIDDANVIKDERIANMSAADKEDFMVFAEKQLHENMVECGWESLPVLLDEYLEHISSGCGE